MQGVWIEEPAHVNGSIIANNWDEIRVGLRKAIKSALCSDAEPDMYIFREVDSDWTIGFNFEFSWIPSLSAEQLHTLAPDAVELTQSDLRIYTIVEIRDIEWISEK